MYVVVLGGDGWGAAEGEAQCEGHGIEGAILDHLRVEAALARVIDLMSKRYTK